MLTWFRLLKKNRSSLHRQNLKHCIWNLCSFDILCAFLCALCCIYSPNFEAIIKPPATYWILEVINLFETRRLMWWRLESSRKWCLCSMVEIYQNLGGTYCLHIQDRQARMLRWRLNVPLKHQCISTVYMTVHSRRWWLLWSVPWQSFSLLSCMSFHSETLTLVNVQECV